MERGLAQAAREECRHDTCVKTGQTDGKKVGEGAGVSWHCGV